MGKHVIRDGLIINGLTGGSSSDKLLVIDSNNIIKSIDKTEGISFYTQNEVGNFFSGTTFISGYNKSNWDSAYSWGNHANAGYANTNHTHNYLSLNGGTLDGGTNTNLTLLSNSSGESLLSLYGSSQGTGRVFVGQSDTHGGGILYNGDGTPSYSGAGSDYITLYRKSNSEIEWTARNKHNNNTWEFRTTPKVGSSYLATQSWVNSQSFSIDTHNHDSVYVNKSGDAMSGSLLIETGSNPVTTTINRGEIILHGATGGNNSFTIRQNGSNAPSRLDSTIRVILSADNADYTFNTNGILNAPTGFSINSGTSNDILLGDGTTTSLSNVANDTLQSVTDRGHTTTNHIKAPSIQAHGSDGLELYGDNNDGTGRGANISMGGNTTPNINLNIGDGISVLGGQLNITNRSSTTLGSVNLTNIGEVNLNSSGSSYLKFEPDRIEMSNGASLARRTIITQGKISLRGGSSGNHSAHFKQTSSSNTELYSSTTLDIKVSSNYYKFNTNGILNAPTGFSINSGTSNDILLGDGTTTSLSAISGSGYSGWDLYVNGGGKNTITNSENVNFIAGTNMEINKNGSAYTFNSTTGKVIGSNLALNKTPTGGGPGSHSNYNFATDGVFETQDYVNFGEGTFSASGTESAYLEIDLGQIYDCLENRIWWYDANSRFYYYNLQYSTDGTTWNYATGSTGTFVASNSVQDEPDILRVGPVEARYWRIYGNGNSANDSNHIYEWEIYEAVGGGSPTWASITGKPKDLFGSIITYGAGDRGMEIPDYDGSGSSGRMYFQNGSFKFYTSSGGADSPLNIKEGGVFEQAATRTWVSAQGFGSGTTFNGGVIDNPIGRSAHNTGHLEGTYNNVGNHSTNTNPIYTIGSSYNPTTTSLNNMYGIGFTKDDSSFINSSDIGSTGDGWGMYVASGGTARIFLNAGDGSGHFKSSIYSGGNKVATESWVNAQNFGSGSGGSTDAETLDGLDSSAFLRSDIYETTSNYLETRRGITGGYGDGAGTGSNWGATIWSMGDSYGGDLSGSGFTTSGYEISWLRTGNGNHNTTAGEGLHIYSQNSFRAAIGHTAAYFSYNVHASDFVGTSDRRLKENIKNYEPKHINSIYKNFNFIEDENKQERLAVIAQELEVHHPEFVRTDGEGQKSVSYNDLHSAEIVYLKKQNDDLTQRVLKLEQLIEKIL